jgi:hypothetical protein
MANEALVPAQPPGAPSEDEYQTFCAALSASARGRAFLAEYARRHRGADTEVLLAALARLEALVRAQAGAKPAHRELRGLIGTIRAARPEIEQSALPARAAKLAMLLDLLERRLEAMAEPAHAAAREAAETARAAQLAVVPSPEEPELPIPSPAAQPPALALAHDRGPPPLPAVAVELAVGGNSTVIIPEVTWLDSAPPPASEPIAPAPARKLPPLTENAEASARPSIIDTDNTRAAADADAKRTMPAIASENGPACVVVGMTASESGKDAAHRSESEVKALENRAASSTTTIAPSPPADPLAVLMALSEEERIALFT